MEGYQLAVLLVDQRCADLQYDFSFVVEISSLKVTLADKTPNRSPPISELIPKVFVIEDE